MSSDDRQRHNNEIKGYLETTKQHNQRDRRKMAAGKERNKLEAIRATEQTGIAKFWRAKRIFKDDNREELTIINEEEKTGRKTHFR